MSLSLFGVTRSNDPSVFYTKDVYDPKMAHRPSIKVLQNKAKLAFPGYLFDDVKRNSILPKMKGYVFIELTFNPFAAEAEAYIQRISNSRLINFNSPIYQVNNPTGIDWNKPGNSIISPTISNLNDIQNYDKIDPRIRSMLRGVFSEIRHNFNDLNTVLFKLYHHNYGLSILGKDLRVEYTFEEHNLIHLQKYHAMEKIELGFKNQVILKEDASIKKQTLMKNIESWMGLLYTVDSQLVGAFIDKPDLLLEVLYDSLLEQPHMASELTQHGQLILDLQTARYNCEPLMHHIAAHQKPFLPATGVELVKKTCHGIIKDTITQDITSNIDIAALEKKLLSRFETSNVYASDKKIQIKVTKGAAIDLHSLYNRISALVVLDILSADTTMDANRVNQAILPLVRNITDTLIANSKLDANGADKFIYLLEDTSNSLVQFYINHTNENNMLNVISSISAAIIDVGISKSNNTLNYITGTLSDIFLPTHTRQQMADDPMIRLNEAAVFAKMEPSIKKMTLTVFRTLGQFYRGLLYAEMDLIFSPMTPTATYLTAFSKPFHYVVATLYPSHTSPDIKESIGHYLFFATCSYATKAIQEDREMHVNTSAAAGYWHEITIMAILGVINGFIAVLSLRTGYRSIKAAIQACKCIQRATTENPEAVLMSIRMARDQLSIMQQTEQYRILGPKIPTHKEFIDEMCTRLEIKEQDQKDEILQAVSINLQKLWNENKIHFKSRDYNNTRIIKKHVVNPLD